jgi:diguanylate cyclase (GGDEF)-like protein
MSGRTAAIRLVRACALVVGLLVLAVSVVTSAVSTRDRQAAAQDSQLGLTLGQQADALAGYFERARAVTTLLAANPVFTDFYRAPGTVRAKIAAGGPLADRVGDALTAVSKLYPGGVDEACFVDQSGAEIGLVVRGVRPPASAVDDDEDQSPFFAPTLALGPGTVYQAKQYKSADTGRVVLSNSAAVTAAGHTGIVHFEIDVDTFRMAAAPGGMSASIIDADSGRVLVDTRAALAGSRPALPLGRDHGVLTLGDRRVAFERVAGGANWYVAVSAPAFGLGWTRGLGVGSLALLLGALLTVLVSIAGSWAHLRSVRRSASYDALTGLPNRTLLVERLRAALRGGRPAVVLVADLERFKEVNDLLGNRHGDLLLRQVAARLTEAAPATATVARLGGDEFAVLLPGAGPVEGLAVAEALLETLHRTFLVDGISLDIECGIGLAAGPAHGGDAASLLRHADAAMHLAKEQHSGCQVYDPAGDQHVPSRLALLGDLRRAIDADDQITLHYQPKIDLGTGRLIGVEALVRWDHPELGRTAPDAFIPLAETTSLIRPLTTKILEIAVAQARAWLDQGLRIPVAVNLSTRCLVDAGFAERVFDLLARAGVPASLLELEITESMIMADPERAMDLLHALRDHGIRLSIDDFGTGHSSMTYLRQLPVDELKIDRSFVREMVANHGNAVLVRSAISLGHNLGLSVVAEGVEDEEVVAALRELGCNVAQGYHFARPMPAAEIGPWLSAFAPASTSLSSR